MKFNAFLFGAALIAVLPLTSCGSVSPEVTVSCGAFDSITASFGTGGGSSISRIRKSVLITDQALSTTVPGRDIEARVVVSNLNQQFRAAGVCDGSCTAIGDFREDITVTTDEDGFLDYYLLLQVAPGQAETNSTIESFKGSANICSTEYTVSST